MSSGSDVSAKSDGKNPSLKALGKYVIERKLGQGGMGTVYLARHTELKKLVALKVLPQDKAKNPILVRRFKAEAQAAAQLEHPNIVAVYDTGEIDGYLYIAMEFVDGIDLFEQVKRGGTIPVKRSIEIIKQVAAALEEASKKNIVHRDIKPSNLLLRQDGTVKVTDLGLARSIDDTLETNITRAGTTVGTVDYMAPEQARNSKAADIRSDIYSLGCTWYQMLTGEPPFPEGSLTNKLQAHAIKPLPDPRERNENIPEGLIAVLQRMTAKKPEDRYQTPAELLDDLNHAKLTKAAFSNEIFSDLSDDDVSGSIRAEVAAAAEELEAPVSRGRSRSRVESDDEEEEDELPVLPIRRKKRSSPTDESHEEPVGRRRNQTRDQGAEPDVEEEESSPAKRRLAKQVSHADDSTPDQPVRKSAAGALTDDVDEAEAAPGKRKRKGQSSLVDAEATSGTRQKSVTHSAAEKADKTRPGSKPTPSAKPLPPKRQPISTENELQVRPNLEWLKYGGIALGIISVVGGLGWMISRWGNQLDVAPPTDIQNAAAVVPVEPEVPKTNSEKAVTVIVEPSKQNTGERPAAEFDIVKSPIPRWASPDNPEPAGLSVFTVGPGATSDTHFAVLDEALAACEKGNGGTIRLVGNGPFFLSPFALSLGKKLVMTAANPQEHPIVLFRGSDEGKVPGLVINRGTLDVRGIHFVLDRSHSVPDTKTTMINVVDGQIYVRNCSFTATGEEHLAAVAIEFSSVEDAQNQPSIEPELLLDRVTIRGNGLTGVEIHRVNAEVVIADSLLVTGSAPVLDVAGQISPSLAEVPVPRPRRVIRILRSTLSGRKRLFDFSADMLSKPPTTALLLQDTVCTAEGSGHSTVLASAVHWPSSTSSANGWLTNLSWTSVASLYLGFDRLIDTEKTAFQVKNLEDWQRVWGKKFAANQFQPMFWQESAIPDISAVMAHDFDPHKLPYLDIKTASGALPGAPVDRLVLPATISQGRLFAMSQRPKLPTASNAQVNTPPRAVDLAKEDLGAILNRNDWPNGTTFEASGAGLRYMSPARLNGRSVKVVFRQADGAPLRVQPKIADQKSKPESPGLFNVENGTLELNSAVLETAQVSKPSAPAWLISATNSTVILRGCQLNGPLLGDLDQHQGLVNWSAWDKTPAAPGSEPPCLLVANSLLLGTNNGLRIESARGNVFVRNSIISIRGYGLSLLPIRLEDRLPTNVDLEHVTFSTTKAAIRIDAAAGGDVITPVRFFVDFCAIVPPLEAKPGEGADASFVECVGPVREENQIEWWSNSNGVAKDVRVLLRQGASDPITSLPDWQKAWGESHAMRMLTGSRGVVLTTPLPNKLANLKVSSFVLDPKSPGATWADGGKPVGAEIRQIEEAMQAKKQESKSGTTNPAQIKNTVIPRKDIGF